MDIHDPKAHTAALGGLVAAVAGIGGYGYQVIKDLPAGAPAISASFAQDIAPLGKHDVVINCIPSQCKFARGLAEKLRGDGWTAHIEKAITSNDDIGIIADSDEVHAFAADLSKDVNEPVKTAIDVEAHTWQIWIGESAAE